MTEGATAGKTSWRGFSHEALLAAISSDLCESGWSNDPTSCTDGSVSEVQFAGDALMRSIFKKWVVSAESAETQALLTFLEANNLSRKWTLPSEFSFNGRFNALFGRIKWELDKLLHPCGVPLITSYRQLWENGKVGPGSSIGAAGASFYAKFGSSCISSGTEDLYLSYRRYVDEFPTWADAEEARSLRYGVANIVGQSNVSFAPKNATTARLICTEPSLNMFAQLGLKNMLEQRILRFWGVSMEDQPEINRFLARQGSYNGSFATLDLTSASDFVSIELCRKLLPEWFFETLMELRSPYANVEKYGLCVELGMISTMGNGFTFPVMTIILSAVVRAVYHDLGIPLQDSLRRGDGAGPHEPTKMFTVPANWAVFGDDIIVKGDAYDRVVEVLGLLGFSVNISKSFSTGPFRESCGHDYYRGLNVRGVYLKRIASLQDLAVSVNLFNEWTARTSLPLRRCVRYLMSLFRSNKVLYVPYSEPMDGGIRIPRSLIPDGYRTSRPGANWLFKTCYKSWVERSPSIVIGDGVIMTPSGCRKLGYNADALLLSFLLGEVRDGVIGVRQNSRLYRTQWKVTPNWDHLPPSYWFNHQSDWRRFQSAVYSNLFE